MQNAIVNVDESIRDLLGILEDFLEVLLDVSVAGSKIRPQARSEFGRADGTKDTLNGNFLARVNDPREAESSQQCVVADEEVAHTCTTVGVLHVHAQFALDNRLQTYQSDCFVALECLFDQVFTEWGVRKVLVRG